ncbi:MAG: MerR family transcriptional regulator [Hyphomicrobiaceae bacterium]
MLSIGALSRQTGVKVPTIRYYEQMGLIEAPERSQGNQRRYSRAETERLGFIKHARDLGLSLEAIRDLVRLVERPNQPCTDADVIAARHLRLIREKIARLKGLECELERIASGCRGESVADCYVLQSLSDHAMCADEH